jgi:RHS repeat-associated protein
MHIPHSINFKTHDRYLFQGQEMDDEVKGEGNSYDFGARMYDSRLGRFLSLDVYVINFPFQSPYLFAENTPIMGIDVNGDSLRYVYTTFANGVKETHIIVLTENDILARPGDQRYYFLNGLKESYQIPIGKETIDKIISSSENDLYIGEYDGLEKKALEESGGSPAGATLLPEVTKKALGKNRTFDSSQLSEEMKDRYSVFDGITVSAKNNYFITINNNYSWDGNIMAEVIFHEISHVDLMIKEKGIFKSAEDHHGKIGQTSYGSDTGDPKAIMVIFRKQMKEKKEKAKIKTTE